MKPLGAKPIKGKHWTQSGGGRRGGRGHRGGRGGGHRGGHFHGGGFGGLGGLPFWGGFQLLPWRRRQRSYKDIELAEIRGQRAALEGEMANLRDEIAREGGY